MATRTEGIQVLGATELQATLKRAGDQLEAAERGVAFPEVAASIRTTGAVASKTFSTGGPPIPVGAPIHFGWPAPPNLIAEAVKHAEPAALGLYTNAVEKILDQVHGV